MSLRYLPEHAESALLALNPARKEAAHLRYTHRTLFAQHIDADYMSDTQLFLQAPLSAREAAEMLFRTLAAIETQAGALGLHSKP